MTAFKAYNLPALFTRYYRTGITDFDKEFLKAANESFLMLQGILDRGISHGDNMDEREVSFTSSGTPNAENTIAHTLGKVPSGFIVVNKDKAAHLYANGTAWSKTQIFLKSDVATVAFKILVY